MYNFILLTKMQAFLLKVCLQSSWIILHPINYWSRVRRQSVSSVNQSCPTLCDPRKCSTQASLSITNSRSLLKLMPMKPMMPSSHLKLCHPLLLLPSIFPSIKVFSNELVLCIRWPKYWSFSFSISPSNKYSGLISFQSIRLYFRNSHYFKYTLTYFWIIQ